MSTRTIQYGAQEQPELLISAGTHSLAKKRGRPARSASPRLVSEAAASSMPPRKMTKAKANQSDSLAGAALAADPATSVAAKSKQGVVGRRKGARSPFRNQASLRREEL